MAAADPDESEMFKSLPKGLPIGEARDAWKRRESVAKLFAEGKTSYEQAGGPNHVTKRGFLWLAEMLKRTGAVTPEDASAAAATAEASAPIRAPAAATSGAPAATAESPQPPPKAPAPIYQEGLERHPPTPGPGIPEVFAPSPNPASPPASQFGGLRPGGRPLSQEEVMRALGGPLGADISRIGPPMEGRPQDQSFGGAFTTPDISTQLRNICMMYNVREPEANGIALQFLTTYQPNDYAALRRVVATAGKPGFTVDSIVNTWRALTKSWNEEGAEPEGTGGERRATIEDLEKRLGVHPGEGGDSGYESDLERLDKEERRTRLEEARLALQERRKSLGLTPGAASGNGDDNMVEVVLNLGGVPVPRRIRFDQFAAYQPYMSRTAGAQSGEEMPAWAKAIMDEQVAQRRERDEDRRRQEQQELIRQATAPMMEEIRALKAQSQGQGQESDTAKQVRELMARMSDKDRESLNQRLDQLQRGIADANTPEGIRMAQARYDAAARQLGYIPRGESAILNEQQIQLESERKAATRKDEATGKAIDIVGNRVNDRPVERLLHTTGLDQVIPEMARKTLSTPEERAGIGQPPSEAELIAAAQGLEQEAQARDMGTTAGDRRRPGIGELDRR